MTTIEVQNNIYEIPESITIDKVRYEHQYHLGNGGNSSVELFARVDTGEEFACKIIPLEARSPSQKRESQRGVTELKILNQLNQISHQHIIKFIAYERFNIQKIIKYKEKGKEVIKYFETTSLFIIMEKADKSLKDLICENEINYAIYSSQILGLAEALQKMHEVAIHRDLKPENILVVGSTWVISDFGLGKFVNGEKNPEITSHFKAIGPRYWLTPEAYSRYININQHRKEIDFKSDIYQMCAIFWFIISRKHPSGMLCIQDFNGPKEIFEVICKGLQHDPSRRFNSTQEFYQELEKVILKE